MPTSEGAPDGEGGLRLTAPAKINLTLEVLGKRDDGFHNLDTVMTTISLADEVRLRPADALSVQFSGRRARDISENGELCAAAVHAMAQASGRAPDVAIEVAKRIPVAAGLAGGSSDAAAVLRGLNQLWDLDWSIEELTDVAARLGSDVPFFLHGGTARCTGRGEVVHPVKDIAPLRLLLLVPPVPPMPNKTARRFGALAHGDFSDGTRSRKLAARLDRGAPPPVRDLVNVFEAVVERSDPELLAHYVRYRAGRGPALHLCGAGPTLYLFVTKNAKIAALRRDYKATGADVIEASTLSQGDALAITPED
jgi:4-diphosphocytidyl-2-C-methyl-D-erythritol kinase